MSKLQAFLCFFFCSLLLVSFVQAVQAMPTQDPEPTVPYDLNGDGIVNIIDVGIKASDPLAPTSAIKAVAMAMAMAMNSLVDFGADPPGITRVQGPIMPNLLASNDSSYGVMANGTYLAYFKNDSYSARHIRFKTGDYVVEFNIGQSQAQWYNSSNRAVGGGILNPQHTNASVIGNTVSYVNAWSNVNLTYTAGINDLQEILAIGSVPANTSYMDYFRFRIDIYYNSSLSVWVDNVNYTHPTNQAANTTGEIVFTDVNNSTIFWIPSPRVWDSNGTATTARYFLNLNNGVDLWYLAIPKSFLDSAVFPIYLDPPTRIQGNARGTQGDGASNTISVTMASTPTAGNILVLVYSEYWGSRTVSSISETNVAWTKQISKAGAGYCIVEIWVGVISASASKNIVVTTSAALTDGVADVCEYNGTVTSGFLDTTATNTGTSTTPDTGTTAATTVASEVWVGGTAVFQKTQATPTNGFTLLDGAFGPSSYHSLAYLEKIVSSTGTADSGTTITASKVWAGCIITIKTPTGESNVPTSTSISSNETKANTTCLLSVLWNDDTNVTGHILYTNNTGSWVADAWVAFSTFYNTTAAWANVTKTLNSTVGNVVSWISSCNDTYNNWANTTQQNITTIFSATLTVNTATHSWSILPGQSDILITESTISLTVTANVNFNIQVKSFNASLTYGTNTIAIGNVTVHKDTLASSIPLTTSYANVVGDTNIGAGTSVAVSFKLWLDCPTGLPAGAFVYTLGIQVAQYT
jgi:hypothetical protein